jgi:hypothetical protein
MTSNARQFTLYFSPISLCSNTLRMMMAQRAATEIPAAQLNWHQIEFSKFDQLEEYFLKLNWKGHVRLKVSLR